MLNGQADGWSAQNGRDQAQHLDLVRGKRGTKKGEIGISLSRNRYSI